ncbi:hypothetical protein GAPWK_2694 [Gilliamella apicola]|nr:hypothetical protein GAPWK_2694 [Gilliamella apicola]
MFTTLLPLLTNISLLALSALNLITVLSISQTGKNWAK